MISADSSREPKDLPGFLEDPHLRLIFFGGKGGVGKTTCAAAAALRYARRSPHSAFLLVSTDPAHSLADCFGDWEPPANLTILEFNALESLEKFKAQHRGRLCEIAARGTFLDEEDLSHLLDLSLPGLDELMALLAIAGWAEARTYELIVVDTAPTGHTLRLLATPELIHNWIRGLEALLAKHRFLRRRFRNSSGRDRLDEFLGELTARAKQMSALLQNLRFCRFVPVMLAEEVVVRETQNLLAELKRLQLPVTEVVVNRFFPENSCPLCASGRRQQQRLLGELLPCGSMAGYRWWEISLRPEEMRGRYLENFWEGVVPVAPDSPAPPFSVAESPPTVEAPSPCATPETAFLIFAGKGGVGKTTLACATALRLAQEFKGKEILLVSTDPAHSLSHCLETDLGPEPVRFGPGLTAMELDAPREFAALKRQYQEELEKFFQGAFQNFDVPFDRQVMERLLDLSPPGLDEIMALLRAMEFLQQGRYDLFILDSAPTGHLCRLLELPELMDQWLKTFFGVLLKYRLAFRFPDLCQQLVKISRNLKLLRALWRDPARTALYPVAILTELAFQETCDLVAVCKRLGLATPLLFLNLATIARECSLCAALNCREARIKNKFQQKFPGMGQTLIYRQDEPRGLKRLRELGMVMYLPRTTENHHGAVTDLPALSS